MEIGKRIFYDLISGEKVKEIGERQINVIPTTYNKDFLDYDETLHGVVELDFGDVRLHNVGSYEVDVDTKEFIIYPKVNVKSDQQTILNDGIDTVIITATIPEDMSLVFTVFDTDYSVDTVNGVSSLEVTTTALGEIIVSVDGGKFGSNSVRIKGVDTVA